MSSWLLLISFCILLACPGIKCAVSDSCTAVSCNTPYLDLLTGLNVGSSLPSRDVLADSRLYPDVNQYNPSVDRLLLPGSYLATADVGSPGGPWLNNNGTTPCSATPAGIPTFQLKTSNSVTMQAHKMGKGESIVLKLNTTLQRNLCAKDVFALVSVDDNDGFVRFYINIQYEGDVSPTVLFVKMSTVYSSTVSCAGPDTKICGESMVLATISYAVTYGPAYMRALVISAVKPIQNITFTMNDDTSTGTEMMILYSLVGVVNMTGSIDASPTASPIASPIGAPVESPVEVSVAAPAEAPIVARIETPVEPPTEAPILHPVGAPIASPTSPAPAGTCGNISFYTTGTFLCEGGQLVVNGTLTVPPSVTVTVQLTQTAVPSVLVDGCVQIDAQSNISIYISADITNSILNNQTRSLEIIRSQSACLSGSFSSAEAICYDPSLCSQHCLRTDQTSSSTSLTLLFTVGCDNSNLTEANSGIQWWGILLVILAAVIIVAAIVIVVLSNKKARSIVFPFAERRDKANAATVD